MGDEAYLALEACSVLAKKALIHAGADDCAMRRYDKPKALGGLRISRAEGKFVKVIA